VFGVQVQRLENPANGPAAFNGLPGIRACGRRRLENSGLSSLWVPNWSSMAVTCGIAVRWQWGMIVGRCGTTAVSDLPTVIAWLGLLARSAPSKKAEILVLRPRGCRVTPPGAQTATVLGRSCGGCSTDPVLLSQGCRSPRIVTPGHDRAVTPGDLVTRRWTQPRRHQTGGRRTPPELRRLV
jgi:hypothetical protein